MCQTTCSGGSTSAWADKPHTLFEVQPNEPVNRWVSKAKPMIVSMHPDHLPGDTTLPDDPSSKIFDIALKNPTTDQSQKKFSLSALCRKLTRN